MIDLGKKSKEEYPDISSSNKNQINYPSVHLYNRSLPISGKDAGRTFTVTMKIKINSVELSTNKKKETKSYGFDLLGIDFGKKGISLEGKSKEELDDLERDEYDRLKR